jgi:MFS family permease
MPIFVPGMKKGILIVAYWLAAIFLTAFLLMSLEYDLWQALLMGLSFLPAAMALSFFLPKVERDKEEKKRVLDTIYIILGVMLMTFLLIFLWQMLFIFVFEHKEWEEWYLPSMLGNPVFVAAILAILAYGHYLLVKWLEKKYPTERPITFTSDYKKVSLKKEDILYVESRDSEVWIVTRDGRQFRNKTGIGQWENLLGPGFLRIHRAFLVNLADATLTAPDLVSIAGQSIPVSRKYKDSVKAIL